MSAWATSASAAPAPILGGTPTTVGEYPSVVVILVGGGLCSGTLITDRWVLTAGHCVTPSIVGLADQPAVTASIRVHFNTIDITQSNGTTIGALSSSPDPDFDPDNIGGHDLGLIELATPVTNITPVPLNFSAAAAPVGITLTQVGFGATAPGGAHVGKEYVVSKLTEACALVPTSPTLDDANLLCWSQTDGTGKCEGDSGGPSFAMIDGALMQVGLTSFGDDATATSPTCSQFGADTRVDVEATFLLQSVPGLMCFAAGGTAATCEPPTADGGCDASGARGGGAALVAALGAFAAAYGLRRRS